MLLPVWPWQILYHLSHQGSPDEPDWWFVNLPYSGGQEELLHVQGQEGLP